MKKLTIVIVLCCVLIITAAGCRREMLAPVPEEAPEIPLDFRTNTTGQLITALHYMGSPIRGAGVSRLNRRLPNAPRTYRNGVHEGLDYFVRRNTPVQAAGDGVVVRADHDFMEMTPEEYHDVILMAAASERTPADVLDRLLGRQVWIEHADGVVTRYAHLESIHETIQPGTAVVRGEPLGGVGNSGTRYSVLGGRIFESAPHLHFEIWYEGVFLGEGRSFTEVRQIYAQVFR